MDINRVTLVGSIKEISNMFTPKNGQPCCWLTILTDIPYQKKDSTTEHDQVNHRVLTYGKYAQVIKEKAAIDQKIFLEGRLKTKSWVHGNTFYEKGFIVLERFKLQTPVKNESQKSEDYDQQQDMVDYGPEIEEELKFNDDDDSVLKAYYEDMYSL